MLGFIQGCNNLLSWWAVSQFYDFMILTKLINWQNFPFDKIKRYIFLTTPFHARQDILTEKCWKDILSTWETIPPNLVRTYVSKSPCPYLSHLAADWPQTISGSRTSIWELMYWTKVSKVITSWAHCIPSCLLSQSIHAWHPTNFCEMNQQMNG